MGLLDFAEPRKRRDRSFLYSIWDNIAGIDDDTDTPGERLGRGVNDLALAMYGDPKGMLGGTVRSIKADMDNLMFEGGAMKRPADLLGYAAAPMAPGVMSGRVANVMSAGGAKPGEINLWHGSPYDFRDFDMGKIGKGEGAQDLGRGFSLTDEQAIAHAYMNPASRWGDLQAMERYRQAGPGRTYQVGVSAAPEQILDWKKPWKSQVKEGTPLYDVIQKRLSTLYTDDPEMQKLYQQADLGSVWRDGLGLEDAATQSGFVGNKRQNYSGDMEFTIFDPSKMNIKKVFDNEGREISLEDGFNPQQPPSKPGIKYRDAGSRSLDGAESGTRNFVVFDDKLISIVKKYGIAGAAAMLGVSTAEIEGALNGS